LKLLHLVECSISFDREGSFPKNTAHQYNPKTKPTLEGEREREREKEKERQRQRNSLLFLRENKNKADKMNRFLYFFQKELKELLGIVVSQLAVA